MEYYSKHEDMKITWIIENIVKESSFLELSQAAKDLGHKVHDLRGDFRADDLKQYAYQCVVFNGSIEMVKLVDGILTKQECYPIKYCNWENYLCTKFYGPLDKYLFNDQYIIVPLIELVNRRAFFFGNFGREANIFIRPDSGEKSFKGGLLDFQDVDSFYNEFEHLRNELVIISTPKTILGEWRFIVTDQKEIVAVSCYRFQGKKTLVPSAPKEATKLVEKILDEGYYPDKIFCIDVAMDADQKCYLLELTSFSSAGLYAADKKKIVEKVSEIAWNDFILTEEIKSSIR